MATKLDPARFPRLEAGRPRVLVACEFSGVVREAFRARGYDAWSCDLLPSEIRGQHIEGDVRNVLHWGWTLMVAHPPCTHLAVSGARWFKDKVTEQDEALEFVRLLLAAPIPRIALENPVSVISSRIRKPDQIIQPWQFGHGETKATCWWLKNLPKLEPTDIVEGREGRVWKMSPSPDRWRERSRTLPGVAAAIAAQWGAAIVVGFLTYQSPPDVEEKERDAVGKWTRVVVLTVLLPAISLGMGWVAHQFMGAT